MIKNRFLLLVIVFGVVRFFAFHETTATLDLVTSAAAQSARGASAQG
jgi:hypothetical protein